jgi:hypothetical protein
MSGQTFNIADCLLFKNFFFSSRCNARAYFLVEANGTMGFLLSWGAVAGMGWMEQFLFAICGIYEP